MSKRHKSFGQIDGQNDIKTDIQIDINSDIGNGAVAEIRTRLESSTGSHANHYTTTAIKVNIDSVYKSFSK